MITDNMTRSFKVDRLRVDVFDSALDLGRAAAEFVVLQLMAAIEKRGKARLILATGTSQFAFLNKFQQEVLDWSRIQVFHLDEYCGLPESHPASFRRYLRERILESVKPGKVHFLRGDAEPVSVELERYEKLLRAEPIDIACIGIGENGHIAFNDPPVADFNDPQLVKVVDLDEACRRQQLGEGWFPQLDDVPRQALSLTIPAILSSRTISCVVPEVRKANAIRDTLYGPITTRCPASILRTHPKARLFLDKASGSML